jgi:hypothetical protein
MDQVARGMSWDSIISEWNGKLTREAIAEAVSLASQALLRYSDEFAMEPASA